MSWTSVKGVQSHSLQRRIVPRAVNAIAPLALGLSLCLVAGHKAQATDFSFTKVVDTNTAIPESTGNFSTLGSPALENGSVAFSGAGANSSGIFTVIGKTVNPVVDTNTLIPNSSSKFTRFGDFWLDHGNVTFISANSSSAFSGKIFTNAGGSLQTLVQSDTPYSGTRGNLRIAYFNSVSSSNGKIVFGANTVSSGAGLLYTVITNVDGPLKAFVQSYDRFYCGDTSASSIYPLIFPGAPVISNGIVAFGAGYCKNAQEQNNGAIFKTNGAPLQLVVEASATPIPGGEGNFNRFAVDIGFDRGTIAFRGFGENQQQGIYTIGEDGQGLQVIADLETPLPENSDTTFASFRNPVINNGNIAFIGSDSTGKDGLYTTLGGKLTKVIATGDVLDDKTVRVILISREAISGEQIGFFVEFTDGSEAIYTATPAGCKFERAGDSYMWRWCGLDQDSDQ